MKVTIFMFNSVAESIYYIILYLIPYNLIPYKLSVQEENFCLIFIQRMSEMFCLFEKSL